MQYPAYPDTLSVAEGVFLRSQLVDKVLFLW